MSHLYLLIETKNKYFLFLLAGVNVLSPPNPVADVVGTPNPVAGFCWLNNPPVGAAAFAPKLPNDEPMTYTFIFNKAILMRWQCNLKILTSS